MALFGRKTSAPEPSGDLSLLLLQGEDMIEQLAAAHHSGWGLGMADSWGIDQTTGLITWTWPDKTATAPVQLLGSLHTGTDGGSWMWAWGNESTLPELRRDAEKVRAWGEEHHQPSLTSRSFPADEQSATSLASIAFRLSEAAGFYRATTGALTTFVTFGPVTITQAGGTSSVFSVEVGD